MTSRSGFLGVAAATIAVPALSASARAQAQSKLYDFASIEAALAKPARHRQVFAVARIAEGNVAGAVNHSLDAYEVTMAQGKGALHPALVLYGRGVVLGLGDGVWKTYGLAEAARRRGETLTATSDTTNPFAASIAALQKRGATVFVCDNALADWSEFLAGVSGIADAPPQIHAALRKDLIAGALLVPAGVATLNMAQEAHFTFVQVSL